MRQKEAKTVLVVQGNKEFLITSCEPNCPNRNPTCHGTCEKYIKETERVEELKAKMRKQKQGETDFFAVIKSGKGRR